MLFTLPWSIEDFTNLCNCLFGLDAFLPLLTKSLSCFLSL
jgi:hypothetical protein